MGSEMCIRDSGIFGRAANGRDLHAEALERFNVNRPNKSGANDTGAKMVKWLHAPLVSTGGAREVKHALGGATLRGALFAGAAGASNASISK